MMRLAMDAYLKEKRMNRFIEYSIEYNGKFSVTIAEKRELVDFMFGKNIIFTDRLEMDTTDIVKQYKDRCVIEDSFKKMNYEDNISVTPMYAWTDQQILIHIFVRVTALLGLRLLRLKMKNVGMEMSAEETLEILRNVYAIGSLYENRKIEWRLSEMNKETERLIDLLNLKIFFDKTVGNTKNRNKTSL
ncbi:MAG: hypothetical protein M1481_01320 [Candidatus Thermoplasmatota archaeon]|nr:hypothetical protein [Candidatus Thermoplasmatota archaeon]MCL5963465.1 hypothetical protein [Candidatus Thermoplasmatota archaeon]